jgi:AcrR family transcriptional regulator
MRTPWGESDELRDRRLQPGVGRSRAATERNQRERLFAALTAVVAERGYEATTVADVVELSGVSRSSFYRHFDDKQECFVAAVDALIGPALERLAADEEAVTDEGRARAGFFRLLELVAAQPAAAKMCLVEIYAAGPEAAALHDAIFDGLAGLAARMYEQIPGREGMPEELVRGIVGGVHKAVYKRLLRGEAETLPEAASGLWEWVLSVPPPPGPLRPARRRWLRPRPFEERQATSSPPDRLLRALAAVVVERGYQETTVADVVERAHTSQRTFYKSFEDKEAAMVAALDAASAQMMAAALPAFRRGRGWAESVRGTQEAMFRFAALEPEYGRLGTVEIYAAGPPALEQREAVTEGMEGLLAAGFELAPEAPGVAPEAIGGALYAMLYDFVKAHGPERLPELLPAAAYITLAPFLGAEKAYAVATMRR